MDPSFTAYPGRTTALLSSYRISLKVLDVIGLEWRGGRLDLTHIGVKELATFRYGEPCWLEDLIRDYSVSGSDGYHLFPDGGENNRIPLEDVHDAIVKHYDSCGTEQRFTSDPPDLDDIHQELTDYIEHDFNLSIDGETLHQRYNGRSLASHLYNAAYHQARKWESDFKNVNHITTEEPVSEEFSIKEPAFDTTVKLDGSLDIAIERDTGITEIRDVKVYSIENFIPHERDKYQVAIYAELHDDETHATVEYPSIDEYVLCSDINDEFDNIRDQIKADIRAFVRTISRFRLKQRNNNTHPMKEALHYREHILDSTRF